MIDLRHKRLCILFLLIISIAYWFIMPIGVDMQFHILRIGELGKELARGTAFPVYMYRDVYSHYGYPVPIFYCSLFLYPFSALAVLGLQAVTAFKVMTVVCMWLTFAVCFLCIRKLPGYEAYAFVGAFIYTIQPFYLNELYVRASIGAAFVFVFIPIVALGLYYVYDSSYMRGALLLGGGMAGIVSSHVISTILIVLLLAVVYLIAIIHRWRIDRDGRYAGRSLLTAVVSAVLCLALTAWYIFPMLEQFADYIFKGQMVSGLRTTAENPLLALIPMHLFSAIAHMMHSSIKESVIGGVAVPVIVLTIYIFITGRYKRLDRTGIAFLVVYYCLSLVLYIDPVWHLLGGILGFLQFAWRIYLITALIGVAFCLYMIRIFGGSDSKYMRAQTVIAVVSAIYILVFFFGYFAARNIMPGFIEERIGHSIAETAYTSETDDNLYIPTCMDETVLASTPRAVSASNPDVTYTYELNEDEGIVDIILTANKSVTDTAFTLPFIMYNGYGAYNSDTGEHYSVGPSEDGFVQVLVPGGMTGTISVSYVGTTVQRVTCLISLITVLIYVGLCLQAYRKQNADKE